MGINQWLDMENVDGNDEKQADQTGSFYDGWRKW